MRPNLVRVHEKQGTNSFSHAWIVTLLLLIALFVKPHTAFAQEETPPWLDNLDCTEKPQHYAGVEYCRGKAPYENIHVVIVRLDNPGIKIEYVIAEGVNGGDEVHECQDVNRSTKALLEPRGPGCDDPNNRNLYPVFSLESAAANAEERYPDSNVAVVINADYSACTVSYESCGVDVNGIPRYREHGPEGLTIVRGMRLDGYYQGDRDNNAEDRPWLAISENPPLTTMIGKLESDNGRVPEEWVYTGVGGAPRLIKDDDVVEWEIASCYNAAGSCYPGASQTAVGLTQDGEWLLFVLAEEQETLLGLAQFMHDQLDCWQAMKFDGGGSSKLWYDGHTIIPGDGRMLTNFLAITAPYGAGIFPHVEPVPEPEPTPKPSWTDHLLEWWQGTPVYQSWQELVNRIEQTQQAIEQAMQDWEELQRNIQDPEWWVEQISIQLSRCCGSAFVPAGLVGGGFWLRRRRRIVLHRGLFARSIFLK